MLWYGVLRHTTACARRPQAAESPFPPRPPKPVPEAGAIRPGAGDTRPPAPGEPPRRPDPRPAPRARPPRGEASAGPRRRAPPGGPRAATDNHARDRDQARGGAAQPTPLGGDCNAAEDHCRFDAATRQNSRDGCPRAAGAGPGAAPTISDRRTPGTSPMPPSTSAADVRSRCTASRPPPGSTAGAFHPVPG